MSNETAEEIKNVRVRIPAHLHARMTELASRERRSLNGQILACMERCAAHAQTAGGADIMHEPPAAPYNPSEK